jgi:hypothetical protein
MGNVGGDPAQMTGGAQTLHASGSALREMRHPLDSQCARIAGAAGHPGLASAVSRFGAAWSEVLFDTGTQALVASQLAAAAAADLTAATGGH